MNPAEIVVNEVQAVGRPQIVFLLKAFVRRVRRRILNTDGEILALNKAIVCRFSINADFRHYKIDSYFVPRSGFANVPLGGSSQKSLRYLHPRANLEGGEAISAAGTK